MMTTSKVVVIDLEFWSGRTNNELLYFATGRIESKSRLRDSPYSFYLLGAPAHVLTPLAEKITRHNAFDTRFHPRTNLADNKLPMP
jgi:hypothetical protein